jgi:hypothetical protein
MSSGPHTGTEAYAMKGILGHPTKCAIRSTLFTLQNCPFNKTSSAARHTPPKFLLVWTTNLWTTKQNCDYLYKNQKCQQLYVELQGNATQTAVKVQMHGAKYVFIFFVRYVNVILQRVK